MTHALLLLRFLRVCCCGLAVAGRNVNHAGSRFDVVPAVYDNRLIFELENKTIVIEQWLDGFEDILTAAIVVAAKLVRLPLRSFQVTLYGHKGRID